MKWILPLVLTLALPLALADPTLVVRGGENLACSLVDGGLLREQVCVAVCEPSVRVWTNPPGVSVGGCELPPIP
jgi:hypothetical protein